jgi:hypothetical protein
MAWPTTRFFSVRGGKEPTDKAMHQGQLPGKDASSRNETRELFFGRENRFNMQWGSPPVHQSLS